MKLPSSSSLLLASLAISSSSSSLSALAAPTGDCPEDSSSPAPVPHGGDSTMAQSNNNLQSRSESGLVGAVNPALDDALRKLLGPVFDTLIGPDKVASKARAGPLDLGGLPFVPAVPSAPGVKMRASGTDESGADTPKDSPTQPSSSSSAPQATASSEAAAPAQPAPATPAAPAPAVSSAPGVKMRASGTEESGADTPKDSPTQPSSSSSAPQATASSEAAAPAQPAPAAPAAPAPKPPALPNSPSDALPVQPPAVPHPGRRDSVNGRAFPADVLSPDLNHIVPTNTPVQP